MGRRVSFAVSTYKLAKEFQNGVEELYKKCPLVYAREYLISGVRRAEIDGQIYDETDRLQAIRKRGISGEMVYILAQANKYLKDCGKAESAEDYLGADVISGDNISVGFDAKTYEAVPSLRVYELFMWFSLQEISDIRNGKASYLRETEI